MAQELIEELEKKEFVDNNSLLELDKLLEYIITYLTDNYKSHEQANSINFIIGQLEDCRIDEVEYLKPKERTIEEETFQYRKNEALKVLQGFIQLGLAGDIIGTDS